MQSINDCDCNLFGYGLRTQHLRGGDASIDFAARQQLRMRARIHHSAKVHHHNAVRRKHCA